MEFIGIGIGLVIVIVHCYSWISVKHHRFALQTTTIRQIVIVVTQASHSWNHKHSGKNFLLFHFSNFTIDRVVWVTLLLTDTTFDWQSLVNSNWQLINIFEFSVLLERFKRCQCIAMACQWIHSKYLNVQKRY